MTKSNARKLTATLLAFFAIIAFLIWGPALGGDPDPGPDVHVPSMENVPPGGTHLLLEVQPEGSGTEGKAE